MSELVLSTDIELRVARRDKAIELFQQASDLMSEAHSLCDLPLDRRHLQYRGGLKMEEIRAEIDRRLWRQSLIDSGLSNLMSERLKSEARSSLEKEVPEFTIDNIVASFNDFGTRLDEIEMQGLVDMFRGLSWDHKSNRAAALTKKVIIKNAFDYRFGDSLYMHTSTEETLTDLERIVCRSLGKTTPPVRETLGAKASTWFRKHQTPVPDYETDDLIIRGFQKGTMHILFKHPSMVETLNRKLAQYYGEVFAGGESETVMESAVRKWIAYCYPSSENARSLKGAGYYVEQSRLRDDGSYSAPYISQKQIFEQVTDPNLLALLETTKGDYYSPFCKYFDLTGRLVL